VTIDKITYMASVDAAIRPATSWNGTMDPPAGTWSPPLTAAEQATLADLTLMARFGLTLTLAEWQQIKPDASALKAFLSIASPSNAQSVAAVKSLIRVLAVIVRS
jgi:hypothetical protein